MKKLYFFRFYIWIFSQKLSRNLCKLFYLDIKSFFEYLSKKKEKLTRMSTSLFKGSLAKETLFNEKQNKFNKQTEQK